jgi:hypothetical protein
MSDRYETIGHDYAATRREDQRIARRMHAALGDARSVVNVAAGAGSYEPDDRYVIAVEPSDVMAAQRPRDRVVILTYDASVSARMWLMADYLPEVAEFDARTLPPLDAIVDWLGGDVDVESIPVHRDTPDWMLGSF